MINNLFGIHDGLATAVRFPSIVRLKERISLSEVAMLLLFGVAAAAAVGFIRTGLRFPGNAILLSMIPMVLGLAFAPRRNAGFIMGTGAVGSAAIIGGLGLAHYGSGAFVSLCLLGPVMDFALKRAKSGRWLYLGIILAGIITNLLALFSRGFGKLVGLAPGTRPFGTWYLQASMTYVLCGAIAGLIAAICFFHLRKKRSGTELQDRP
ncbi:MAG: hypothetical protein P8Z37_09680 [Acidobacteriota bacterium]